MPNRTEADRIAQVLLLLNRSIAPSKPPADPITAPGERPCPICGEVMIMTTRHGVPIDVCPGHGLWLDQGKLDRLLSAMRSGGRRPSMTTSVRAKRGPPHLEPPWITSRGVRAEKDFRRRSGPVLLKNSFGFTAPLSYLIEMAYARFAWTLPVRANPRKRFAT
jgi:Zn-finger nucleic acid-binding protein